MEALYENNVGNSFNNVAFPANGTAGTPFAVTAMGQNNQGRTIAWRTSFTGGPSAVDVRLQGSLDNTNWFDLDNSTVTAGEYKRVVEARVKFVRAFLTTRTGGTNITVEILV